MRRYGSCRCGWELMPGKIRLPGRWLFFCPMGHATWAMTRREQGKIDAAVKAWKEAHDADAA